VFDMHSVRHSCCPNTVLSFQSASDPSDAAPLRATLRACCDVAAGEELSRSWVDASLPLLERAAALAQLLPPGGCGCELCAAQAALAGGAAMPDASEVAARAAARNSHALAEAACRYMLLPSSAAGDGCNTADVGVAWYGLGVALLGLGRWHEGHLAFATGAIAAPAHAALASLAAAQNEYPPVTLGSLPPPPPHSLLDCGAGRRLALGLTAAFSPADCSAAVAEAEEAAAARGGWTTQRHAAVPTTDMPLSALPRTRAAFSAALASHIAPMLEAAFPAALAAAAREGVVRLRVHDAFLVRYDVEGGQCALPPHRDQGMVSLTLALSAPGLHFDGGGTWFADRGSSVALPLGSALLFPSRLLHAGQAISRGRRYVIAAFLWFDSEACVV
jgi:predicted 2-oxoglutarate/Fe(II)-dependent dioxygenase YbiX